MCTIMYKIIYYVLNILFRKILNSSMFTVKQVGDFGWFLMGKNSKHEFQKSALRNALSAWLHGSDVTPPPLAALNKHDWDRVERADYILSVSFRCTTRIMKEARLWICRRTMQSAAPDTPRQKKKPPQTFSHSLIRLPSGCLSAECIITHSSTHFIPFFQSFCLKSNRLV